jgi:hypothetical protein
MRGERYILLGPLERADLNHCVQVSSRMKTEADPIPETLSPLVYRRPDDGHVQMSVILRNYEDLKLPIAISHQALEVIHPDTCRNQSNNARHKDIVINKSFSRI